MNNFQFFCDDGSKIRMLDKGIKSTCECHGHLKMYFCYMNKNFDFFFGKKLENIFVYINHIKDAMSILCWIP
jgi:hypothetical protein